MPFIQDPLDPRNQSFSSRYASNFHCWWCRNINCPISKDDPLEPHDKHDVDMCYSCGDLYRGEEGGTIERGGHSVSICPDCDDKRRHW